ncbi:hypothetical protein ACNRDG_21795 [Ralstonia pseudosolanacearum]|uniref:Uncharacterized protein n=1 Tax=Ralstonia nicotianae (strain ATCC BAA-1114 / GMI1000) TaxID=267608 RepID=Q8XUI5_RALN1|nr:hypothetical protein CDC45_16365 [Ralstonia pseudosolanacearum]CAD16991.1 conserved hypothetical protein [Ralstonia pseudosolanacearum GMI1000]
MLPVPPAIDTEAASAHPPTVFRLGIREALQGALARAVIVQTQQLDLQQQRDQTEQASHEFLPQTVLSSQLERDSASVVDVPTTHSTATSGNVISTWKLRSDTQLSLSEGRRYNRLARVR